MFPVLQGYSSGGPDTENYRQPDAPAKAAAVPGQGNTANANWG